MSKTIAHILGGWSPNIGNSFFQLGGEYVLKQVLPDAHITRIQEQPGYPSYWNPKGGNPANYFDMASAIEADYLVLMGPLLRPETEKIWGASLQKIISNGTRLVLLGVAAMKYDQNNIKQYRDLLKKYKPYLLTTRDKDTFNFLGDLADHSYNGIDFAFFVPDFYEPRGLANFGPYIAINFDKIPEPRISIVDGGKDHKTSNFGSVNFFEFNKEVFLIQETGWRKKVAKKSRYFMFLESLIFPGPRNTYIGKYKIIRTDHRSNPIITRGTFRSPNTVMNDTPYPYFEIYGNADLTLSNRLHACVIALSFGKPAMLFSESPRSRLLERLGLSDITKTPMTLDLKKLNREKTGLVSFLNEHF